VTDIAGDDTFFTNMDGELTQTQWESLIDQAIDKINGYGAQYNVELPNMTGTAGSKTLSVSSAEAGFIRSITARLYNVEYKLPGSDSVGAVSETVTNLTMEVESLAKEAAERLRDLDVTVGADASF